MGYYTYHTLEIVYGDPDLLETDTFKQLFNTTTGYQLDDLVDSVKWYESDKNMISISLQFPDTVFYLLGDGEDQEDNWHFYYCNGKKDGGAAKLVYPTVDVAAIGNIGHRCPEYFI